MTDKEIQEKIATLCKELESLDKRYGYSITKSSLAPIRAKKIEKTLEYLVLQKIDFVTGNQGVHIRIYDAEGSLWFNFWPSASKLHEIDFEGTLTEVIGFHEIFNVLEVLGE